MRKSIILMCIWGALLFSACQSKSSYQEAKWIAKVEELQHQVDDLSFSVKEYQKIVAELESHIQKEEVPTLIISPSPSTEKSTETTKQTTKQTTKKSASTTKDTLVAKELEWNRKIEIFKQDISALSQAIASTIPKELQELRNEQFTLYQENIQSIAIEIEEYKLFLKGSVLEKLLREEEYIDAEKGLNKLYDALFMLEDQLEFKFSETK